MITKFKKMDKSGQQFFNGRTFIFPIIIGLATIIIFCVHISTAGFACVENPCFHGICIDDLDKNDTHQCYCRNGFTGYECQINWDECTPNPCLNNGICSDDIASFNCSCPANFAGSLCQYDLTDCIELSVCQNNGTCTIGLDSTGNETFTCLCLPGFSGPQCEFDVSMCNTTENICMNGGQCVDGVGDQFRCICEPGWEGKFCQKMIDNCLSQPCQSGGICVNKLNNFACACPFGYTGKTCEKKLKICEVNPCQNGAFCLHEDPDESKITCYCVPDYHGELCQFKYDDCSPGPKCFNGGTCIDGVGGFSCSCPPGLFGPTCQCTAENMTEPGCQVVNATSVTPSWIFPPATATSLHPASSAFSATFSESLFPGSDVLIPGSLEPSITATIPSITTTLFDESFSISTTPGEIVSSVYPEGSEMFSDSSTLFSGSSTPALEGSEEITIVSSTVSVSIIITDLISQGMESKSTFIPSSLVSFTGIESSKIVPDDEIGNPSISATTTATISETGRMPLLTSSVFIIPADTATMGGSESSISWDFSTIILEPDSTSQVSELFTATTTPPLISPTILIPESTFRFSDLIPASTGMFPPSDIGDSFNISMSSTDIEVSSTVPHIFPSDWSLENASMFSTDTIEIHSQTFDILSSTISPSTPISTPEPSSISIPPSEPTPTPSPPINGTTTDPCLNHCLNNGKCLLDSIEPTCICPFKFFGNRCEKPMKKLASVSFTGDSFLEYRVPNDTINKISVKAMMATIVPDSILFFMSSSSGRLYSLVFTQGGHITLHLSCGSQSMHFVETRTRVDNGHNFTLEIKLEMVVHAHKGLHDTEVHCVGQVSVNHSYIMRGEQIVGHNEMYENPVQFMYLGGVDMDTQNVKKSDDLIGIMPGFRGCLYSLSINEEENDVFDDAINGKDVEECAAFGCVTNPCFGTSKCTPSNKFPYYECLCSPGYQGARCRIRVCDSNPCMNGATCTYPQIEMDGNGHNQTGLVSPLCLCPFGFSGPLCQSKLNITKPSFKSVSGNDYSSFIAYEPIPRFADWVQMKLHFVPRNISQISLILYAGHSSSGSSESLVSNPDQIEALTELVSKEKEITQEIETELMMTSENESENKKFADFFAITYVQGYIALTWNLGTGTQRIITPSRIDKRINVHTLFAGRAGRQAWLKVDGMRNVTGKSPGPFLRLNVNSELFVGGYESFRFEGLPHDLPMHGGFEGCIFDFGFRVKNRLYLPRPLRGRSVKNCYEEDC